MKPFRKHIPFLLLPLLPFLLGAAVSCSVFDSEVVVDDLSFEVSPEIAWNSDFMAYTLLLGLQSGTEGTYTFNYQIDGDPLIRLETADGSETAPGSGVELSRQGGTVFVLPPLSPSERHTITMEFLREGVSRVYMLDLPNTSQNAVGVRVDASQKLEYTRVVLTNLMEATVTAYTVTFYLDGELLSGIKYLSRTFSGTMELDFARSESYTFELPYVVAGSHTLRVDVRSELGSESTSVPFTEPQRRRTSLAFSYNHYTGDLTVSSDYNPSSTKFTFTTDITVNGSLTRRPKRFLGISEPETELYTETGEASVSVTPGLTAVPIDEGKLFSLMTALHAHSGEDAANAIGNANVREVHADINSIKLELTVHSEGTYAGKTAVTITPAVSSGLPVKFTYTAETWNHGKGYEKTITPAFTVNGTSPQSVSTL